LSIEHEIYPQALRLLATDGIRIEGDVCRTRAGADRDDQLISPTLI
jgi:phosphoribosylglycinamide formyltransferase-1